jgi:hypothetical protein
MSVETDKMDTLKKDAKIARLILEALESYIGFHEEVYHCDDAFHSACRVERKLLQAYDLMGKPTPTPFYGVVPNLGDVVRGVKQHLAIKFQTGECNLASIEHMLFRATSYVRYWLEEDCEGEPIEPTAQNI